MAKIKEPIPPKALEVIMHVSDVFGVSVDNILGKCRLRDYTEARHTAIHILYMNIYRRKNTLSRVGAWFGRDHTTVIHARNNVQNWIEIYPEFKERYELLMKKTSHLRKNRTINMTIDERLMRLPEHEKNSIMAYISKVEQNNGLDVCAK